jgi:hypothetical protein
MRRAAVPRAADPAAAAHNTPPARGIYPSTAVRGCTLTVTVPLIFDPLPDVPMQVIESPEVGPLLTDRVDPAARVFVEPGVIAKGLGVIAARPAGLGPCAAGILPLGLAR